MAVFSNSGQICSAGTRMFVERKIYEEFSARVAKFGKTIRVDNSADPATESRWFPPNSSTVSPAI
jgi:aldehyde dehydrogenase (NAD+)